MKFLFRLSHVRKCFGHTVALDDVSLEAPPGVVIALLGENGAGKTTSLKILLGLCDPDQGEAEVLGLNSRRQGREISAASRLRPRSAADVWLDDGR